MVMHAQHVTHSGIFDSGGRTSAPLQVHMDASRTCIVRSEFEHGTTKRTRFQFAASPHGSLARLKFLCGVFGDLSFLSASTLLKPLLRRFQRHLVEKTSCLLEHKLVVKPYAPFLPSYIDCLNDSSKCLAAVRAAVEFGAYVETRAWDPARGLPARDKTDPMLFACRCGHLPVMMYLYDKGCRLTEASLAQSICMQDWESCFTSLSGPVLDWIEKTHAGIKLDAPMIVAAAISNGSCKVLRHLLQRSNSAIPWSASDWTNLTYANSPVSGSSLDFGDILQAPYEVDDKDAHSAEIIELLFHRGDASWRQWAAGEILPNLARTGQLSTRVLDVLNTHSVSFSCLEQEQDYIFYNKQAHECVIKAQMPMRELILTHGALEVVRHLCVQHRRLRAHAIVFGLQKYKGEELLAKLGADQWVDGPCDTPVASDKRTCTPLRRALDKGDTTIIRAVLKANPKALEAYLKGPEHPISYVLAMKSTEGAAMLQILCEHAVGVSLNEDHVLQGLNCPPGIAAEYLKVLFKFGAPVDFKVCVNSGKPAERRVTALYYCLMSGRRAEAELFRQHGVNVNKPQDIGDKDYQQNQTPLCYAISEQSMDAVSFLLEAGADVHAPSSSPGGHEMVPIMLAIRLGALGCLQLLLKHGTHVNKVYGTDVAGEKLTPLGYAVRLGYVDLVRILCTAGSGSQSRAVGKECTAADGTRTSPLGLACKLGLSSIAKVLCEHGADIDYVSDSSPCSTPPLMLTAGAGHLGTVKYLLSKGAQVDTEDEQGRTARDYARDAGHTDIVRDLSAAVKKREQAAAKERERLRGQVSALQGRMAEVTAEVSTLRRMMEQALGAKGAGAGAGGSASKKRG